MEIKDGWGKQHGEVKVTLMTGGWVELRGKLPVRGFWELRGGIITVKEGLSFQLRRQGQFLTTTSTTRGKEKKVVVGKKPGFFWAVLFLGEATKKSFTQGNKREPTRQEGLNLPHRGF